MTANTGYGPTPRSAARSQAITRMKSSSALTLTKSRNLLMLPPRTGSGSGSMPLGRTNLTLGTADNIPPCAVDLHGTPIRIGQIDIDAAIVATDANVNRAPEPLYLAPASAFRRACSIAVVLGASPVLR